MIEVLLPDGAEFPVDESRVAELVEAAIRGAVRELRSIPPPEVPRAVCRPVPNGWATLSLPFLICLGSSDQSILENRRSVLVRDLLLLRAELVRRQIAETGMRTDSVVVLPPRLDCCRRFP